MRDRIVESLQITFVALDLVDVSGDQRTRQPPTQDEENSQYGNAEYIEVQADGPQMYPAFLDPAPGFLK